MPRAFGRQRLQEREREPQRRHRLAEFRPVRPIPRDDGIELAQRLDQPRGRFRDAEQVQPRRRDGAHPAAKPHQRNHARGVQTSNDSVSRHASAGSETIKSPMAPGRMTSLRIFGYSIAKSGT